MHKKVSPKYTICFMDLANYLNISLKPILANNFESSIETGGASKTLIIIYSFFCFLIIQIFYSEIR